MVTTAQLMNFFQLTIIVHPVLEDAAYAIATFAATKRAVLCCVEGELTEVLPPWGKRMLQRGLEARKLVGRNLYLDSMPKVGFQACILVLRLHEKRSSTTVSPLSVW